MNETGRRIAKAREDKGLNQSELARRLGVTPQSVQAWESGKNLPRYKKLTSIADVLGVSVAFLMADQGKISRTNFLDGSSVQVISLHGETVVERLKPPLETGLSNAKMPDSDELIEIPKFDVRASMGDGCALSDGYIDLIQRMTVSLEWLKQQSLIYTSPDNLAIITGDGDSMAGTFNHGDALLVDRGITELKSDAVYVFAIDGEIFIKRLQRLPGGDIRVISDNKLYESYTITDGVKERFILMARVLLVWNARKL